MVLLVLRNLVELLQNHGHDVIGCDSAQTRSIVESGLPLLAASLREAGLTLSGGGVSQHTPEQRQESNPGGAQPAPRFNAEHERSASVRTLHVSAGRLDTYA